MPAPRRVDRNQPELTMDQWWSQLVVKSEWIKIDCDILKREPTTEEREILTEWEALEALVRAWAEEDGCIISS